MVRASATQVACPIVEVFSKTPQRPFYDGLAPDSKPPIKKMRRCHLDYRCFAFVETRIGLVNPEFPIQQLSNLKKQRAALYDLCTALRHYPAHVPPIGFIDVSHQRHRRVASDVRNLFSIRTA